MRWIGGALWDLTDRQSDKDTDSVGQLLMGTLRFTHPMETAGGTTLMGASLRSFTHPT
jgi:hypothetical protein